MACNHHDSGRRCNRPTDGTPYCTLHAVSPEEPGVGPEPTPSREFECEVGSEDVPLAETAPAEAPSSDDPYAPEPDDPEGGPEPAPHGQLRCGIPKADGTACEATPQRDSAFCIFHDPDYQEQRRLNSANGGRAPRRYGPRAQRDLAQVYVDTQSPAGIQAIITAVVGLELTGQINPARSRNILRALSVAARNINMNRVNREQYCDYLEPLEETLADCVAAAWENDAPPPKPPRLDPLHAARAARHAQLTSRTPPSPRTYASAAAYLNKLAAQYLNADD